MTEPTQDRKRAIPWRRASRGLIWVGIGFFLLLTTTGALPASFWFRAAAFWPVLLIGAGLRILFQSSRTPWLVLLSPILILSTLTWVALTDTSSRGEVADVRAERPEGCGEWSLEGTLAFARVEVGTRALPEDLLLEGSFRGLKPRAPQVRRIGDTARVEIPGPGTRAFIPIVQSLDERWALDVTEALPMKVDLEMAFTNSDLDLTRARVERADFQGAFNRQVVRLAAPDEEVLLSWDGAFNVITLIVPEDTPVRVRSEGLVSVSKGRTRREREGPGYRVSVDGAFNRLRVRSE